MSLKGKVAVITGASRGIGRAIAIAFANHGCDVALIGRDVEQLETVATTCRQLGVKAMPCALDLRQYDQFEDKSSEIRKAMGRVDFLINNAGSGGGGHILEVDAERWDQCLETNVMGLMHWTKQLAPEIIKHKGGAIINIASIAARSTYKGGGAYAASKHAVLGFTGCLFEDLREYGIKVCAILPGFVDTEMVTNESLKREKMIAPEDVADAAIYISTSSERVCPTEIVLRPQHSPY